jgi:hypothetical protein
VAKLIVISILLVTVAAATWQSTARTARSGLRKAQWITVLYVFLWAYMCLNWYPQLVPVEPSVKRDDGPGHDKK